MATVVNPAHLQTLDPLGMALGGGIGQGMANRMMEQRQQQEWQKLLGGIMGMYQQQGGLPSGAGFPGLGGMAATGAQQMPNLQGLGQISDPRMQTAALQMLMQQQQTPFGKVPGWWQFATPEQKQAYMDRVGGPMVNIQTGQKLLTGEQRQDIAEEDYRTKMQPSTTLLNTASAAARDILEEIPTKGVWGIGKADLTQKDLLNAYDTYRTEINYDGLSAKERRAADNIWDNLIAVKNRTGYKDIGKGELQWNPRSSEVQKLRQAKPIVPPKQTTNILTRRIKNRDVQQSVLRAVKAADAGQNKQMIYARLMEAYGNRLSESQKLQIRTRILGR